jgi:hypothetical protein
MAYTGTVLAPTLAGALAVAVSGRAVAQEDALLSRHRVGVELGAASAIGALGLVYQFAATHVVRVEGGVGVGFSGVQLSLMPKLVAGRGTCGFVAGFGASLAVGGTVGDSESASSPQPEPGAIPWLNLDVPGLECHNDAGFSFEATLGVTMALKTFRYEIADTGAVLHAGSLLPQGRLGLGYWF